MTDTLGKAIKKARLDKGMTQVALAGKTGVTRAAVAIWEADKAKPRLHILQDIARILQVEIGELLRNGKSVEEDEQEIDGSPAPEDDPDAARLFARLRALARKEIGIDLNNAQILQWLVKLAQIDGKLNG